MKSARDMKPDKPRVLRTDKYEIKIYPNGRKIYFYRLDIKLGEVVPRKSPQFIWDMKEYTNYIEVLSTLIAWIVSWAGLSIANFLQRKKTKVDPNYKGDGREYLVQGKI